MPDYRNLGNHLYLAMEHASKSKNKHFRLAISEIVEEIQLLEELLNEKGTFR